MKDAGLAVYTTAGKVSAFQDIWGKVGRVLKVEPQPQPPTRLLKRLIYAVMSNNHIGVSPNIKKGECRNIIRWRRGTLRICNYIVLVNSSVFLYNTFKTRRIRI